MIKPITNQELEAIGFRIDEPIFIVCDLKTDARELVDELRSVIAMMAADRRRLFDVVCAYVEKDGRQFALNMERLRNGFFERASPLEDEISKTTDNGDVLYRGVIKTENPS